MPNLIQIMESLREQPRPLNAEEDAYLNTLMDEVASAENDAQRWRILEREGMNRINIEAYGFDADVLAHVFKLRRASMN